MKTLFLTFAALSFASFSLATEEPNYVAEAPLPKGWPVPGPYNKVVEKTYPDYRAAFTDGGGETMAFWTLFRHIKRNEIPMTAPVEMPVDDRKLSQQGMAFLYQNDEVGTEGPDGSMVQVKDVPSAKALTYAWQGKDSKKNKQVARQALDAEISKRGALISGYRLLGYNGPGTPRDKKTWELQALLK